METRKAIKLDFDTGSLLTTGPQNKLTKQELPKGPCSVSVRKIKPVRNHSHYVMCFSGVYYQTYFQLN